MFTVNKNICSIVSTNTCSLYHLFTCRGLKYGGRKRTLELNITKGLIVCFVHLSLVSSPKGFPTSDKLELPSKQTIIEKGIGNNVCT